ncbi:hypothetical protein ABT023_09745 [Micromonospora sp. NPDC002296]|uniref:hypothetical protein n=1 Tax=Micromonospora sp. NPDC002296 TaxID=3154271 RepID=UPI0033322C83
MPLPLYAPPVLRSSRSPNPFDRAQATRLRILIDAPLVAGPVDGAGDYHGYPFLPGGSTGYPDAATVLRSYFTHPRLEILRISEDLAEVGDVVLGEPEPLDPDSLSFEVKTDRGERYTGIDYYGEAVEEGAAFASQHGITLDEGLQAALLYRVGAVLEADLIVTDREWLLAERGRPHGDFLAPLVSSAEALALIGLYLRWHRQPVIVGGAVAEWHPTAMRSSGAYTAMPAFERWNQAGRAWHDRSGGDLRIENLNKTLLTRVSRAFQFRDSVFALAATMAGFEPEELLCELDSLLFSLVGAFDVAARITDLLLGMNGGRSVGWQYTKSNGWQKRLEPIAEDLYDATAAGTEMQRAFQVLRWLRNSVHNEALDLTREKQRFYVTVESGTQDDLRGFLREGHTGWDAADLGIRVQPPGGATAAKWLPGTGRYSVTVRRTGAPRPADPLEGTLIFEGRQLINKLFPACLSALDQIMLRTPLTGVPGYHPGLDQPSRANLPWNLSDTTGHRLRFLYGITELT